MNILALIEDTESRDTMEDEKPLVSTLDKNKGRAYSINDYTVNVKYTQGKSLYECMESAVKKMNQHLQYKVL